MCAAILLVAYGSCAFAEVQNVKVSGDLTVTGVSRDQFLLGTAEYDERQSSVIMSQVRIRIDADLTDNVSTTVRLLNERDWDQEGRDGDDTDIDLDLAYVTMKEMLYSPLTVTLGRQELRFGNGFIIGDPDTNRTTTNAVSGLYNRDLSMRKAFDAIRATLDYDPLTVDMVYALVDENAEGGLEDTGDDEELYGINFGYDVGDDMGTIAEAYLFYYRDANTNASADADGGRRTDTIFAPGLRVSTNPIDNLNLQAEIAMQLGKDDIGGGVHRERKALAGQVMANYALEMDMSPTLGVVYSYFSGDADPADVHVETRAWNPMFEDQTSGHIINVLYQATNCHVIDLKGSLEPIEDLTVALNFVSLWLDQEPAIGRYGTSGANILTLNGPNATNSTPVMTGKRDLGHEVDLALTYDYTEDVQLGLLYGYYVPGSAFDGANKDNASEVIASCKVLF